MFVLTNSKALLPYLGDSEVLDNDLESLQTPLQTTPAPDELPSFTEAIQQLAHESTPFYPAIKTTDTDLLQLEEPMTIELVQKCPLGSTTQSTSIWSTQVLSQGTHMPDMVSSTLRDVCIPLKNTTPESVHGYLSYSIRISYVSKPKTRFLKKPQKVSALLPLTILRNAPQSDTDTDRGARYLWPQRADVTLQLQHSKLVNDIINLKMHVTPLQDYLPEKNAIKLKGVEVVLTQHTGSTTSTYPLLRDQNPPKTLDYSLTVKNLPLNSSTSSQHPYPVSHLVSTTLRFQFWENNKVKYYDVRFKTRVALNLNGDAPPIYST